ncbi:thermostable hemolysin [Thioalkalivibrio sp. XN279]|uniref:thermostable hemolysin n=1 Tax=Thioalkalivibrio sp. XN279 TaxID=2714953 RepID=UPI00140A2E3C|nr:thermostable hemolysin [Thioalkalivibrio sp. XN279]NHA16004.1 hypothetical protein [Thioalkalivibrio sp. XN279]
MAATANLLARRAVATLAMRHAVVGTPGRANMERFIAATFGARYGATICSFAPNLVALERHGEIYAAAGWRCAGDELLFLETYLDDPIEALLAHATGQAVARHGIAEVGHLSSARRGGTVDVIAGLSRNLARLGFEWVVFTATAELISIFNRLSLPLLALAPADPARLGDAACDWGTYYDTRPVVVAGPIRLALHRSNGLG